jgi:hypothetical protein
MGRRRSHRRHDPLTDGWVCPRCGATWDRHGRGGARACKTADGVQCRGLECECEDGRCYSKRPDGFGWRRSPCKTARCYHCGWEGEVRSREFERVFKNNMRCIKSNDGWHHPNMWTIPNAEPNSIVAVLQCALCKMVAVRVIPADTLMWGYPMGDVPGPWHPPPIDVVGSKR